MAHRDRTVTAFGRTWSHRNFYGLVRALMDNGLLVEFGGRHCCYWCAIKEGFRTILGASTTPSLALCEAVEKLTAREAGKEGGMSGKPECDGCGADDYEGEIGICPFCDRTKCSLCDPGNDVPCGLCEEDCNDEED